MSRTPFYGKSPCAAITVAVLIAYVFGVISAVAANCHAIDVVERIGDGHGGSVQIDYRTLRPARSYLPGCYDAETETPLCAPIIVTADAQLAAAEDVLWNRMPWYERLGFGGYALGSALDIASTQACIARGGVEANPFYRGLFGARPTVPQMAVATIAVGWGVTYIAHKRNYNARRVLGAVGVARGVIAASNVARCVL